MNRRIRRPDGGILHHKDTKALSLAGKRIEWLS